MFEPFVTSKANGTGLGLAKVQSTLQAHEGAVSYRKAPAARCDLQPASGAGGGSYARGGLPMSRPGCGRRRMKMAPAILVVDDEKRLGEVLAAALTERGFETTAVSSAAAALAHCEANALISCSRTCGCRTAGAGLLLALKEGRPDLPVIIMTAYARCAGPLTSSRTAPSIMWRSPSSSMTWSPPSSAR